MSYFQVLIDCQDAFDDVQFPQQFEKLFNLIAQKPQLLQFFSEAYNASLQVKSDKILKSITFVSIAVELEIQYQVLITSEYQTFITNVNGIYDVLPFFKDIFTLLNGTKQVQPTIDNLKNFLQRNLITRQIQKVFSKQCNYCNIQCYPKHKCQGLQEKEGKQYFRAKWSTKEEWIENGNGQRKIEELK
ncbi:hypothetical protein SS50377_25636 [Spironucleus salmonicida]|uniref:Uncharacterized protein n=1 Tax=Spironucleus salmonicida TaxID=348837 RepID=V6LYW2_9EUKA|nr:hypothetical protein SS50377_25636 [Spironucleus salmonicida]|eukprot:EST49463.1 Hypothetical protein SS50377_10212 [Spironucleus salmonicida]